MKIPAFLCFILVILYVSSCQEPASRVDSVEYAEFISGYTSGMISKKDAVRIRLSQPVSGAEVGKEIPGQVFKFEPAVKGKAYLSAEDMIEFRPETEWPAGKEIKALFSLGQVMKVPEKLQEFSFDFSIVKPSFSINPGNCSSKLDIFC